MASVYPADDNDHNLTGNLTGRGENLTGNLTGVAARPAAFTVLHRAGPESLFSLRGSGFTLPMGPNYQDGATRLNLSNESNLSNVLDQGVEMEVATEQPAPFDDGTMIVATDNNHPSTTNTTTHHTDHYVLTARSVRENLRRLLRAMQLPRPILLEGRHTLSYHKLLSNRLSYFHFSHLVTLPLTFPLNISHPNSYPSPHPPPFVSPLSPSFLPLPSPPLCRPPWCGQDLHHLQPGQTHRTHPGQ